MIKKTAGGWLVGGKLLIAILSLAFHCSAFGGDVVGKVIAGYQGWFRCAGDGSPFGTWVHWSAGTTPSPGNQKFELWPDMTEYTAGTFNTAYAALGNGGTAKLFSAYNSANVNKHFNWMQTYGIDGAAVQRFGSELSGSALADRNTLITSVKNASQTYGRKFYVMYDLSNMSASGWVTTIENDWLNNIVGGTGVASSTAYAKEGTKKVVCFWGVGYTHCPGTAAEYLSLINWFKGQGCFVIGGTPHNWRTGGGKPGFGAVYDALNMISPWTVGVYANNAGADSYMNNFLVGDRDYCASHGIVYQPVFFAGFAWSNWNGGSRNQIPRNKGSFMWQQVYNLRRSNIGTAYIAMFDEYDEGTAIMKGATDSSMIPGNQYFLTLSADGTFVSSDFYLRLAGKATRVIKALDANSSTVPIPVYGAPVWFRTGLEYDTTYTYDPFTTWNNTVDWKVNVGPHGADPVPQCIKVLDQPSHKGRGSILCKGTDQNATTSYCYFKTFDVNIPVNAATKLRYWSYPEGALGRYVAVDFIMTDGTSLRDSGAVDQNGLPMHPAQGRGTIGTWSQTICNIGQWLNGKTIDRILIAYDHGVETGPFVAWLDDVEITDN